MIHRIFIKPTGQLEFSSFDVYESIPTMKFLIDEKYHSWKLNYKGIKSTYIKVILIILIRMVILIVIQGVFT